MNINLYGFITGIVFGILLQRSRVIRYDKQLGALLLKDMTIVKFMLSMVLTGVIGVYLLNDLGIAKLSIKPMIIGAVVFGGLLFGIGWGLLGYCPATSLGALGEGRLDALSGILGMILGAGIFAEAYPWVKKNLLTIGDYGKITLPGITGIN
ncbi:MAG: YeeE/YedE family protein, partial [Candidatus Omnitrophica bacterium]|nr:YeeE/YedE family protein [Candidatus Omnitrophota bacterium]